MKHLVIYLYSLLFLLLSVGTYAQTEQSKGTSDKLRAFFDKAEDFELNTSVFYRYGYRVVEQDLNDNSILNEIRNQWDLAYFGNWFELRSKTDLGYDAVLTKMIFEPRELKLEIFPALWWDLKIGRQILTWGKGDYVFINDLFPKDYRSFLSGRNIEYLKAPSDAIKLTLQPSWFQFNLVYTPQFDADRFPKGDRILQLLDQNSGQYFSSSFPIQTNQPDRFFRDDELAYRFQKNMKGLDLALYGYHGFWKLPVGFDPTENNYAFPKLHVYGFSMEWNLAGFIWATEWAYYDSSEDRDGSDPFIRNGENRFLLNLSRQFTNGLNLGLQYYSEYMHDFDAYQLSAPTAFSDKKRRNNYISLRIEKTYKNQRLQIGSFAFLGLANGEIYILPSISYKLSDYWLVDFGASLVSKQDATTNWGPFVKNNHVHFGFKWAI